MSTEGKQGKDSPSSATRTTSAPSHDQRWLETIRRTLPQILHAYNLAIEQKRTPIIDVLTLSSGTNHEKRRLLSRASPRSATSFALTVPVEPGIEGGFCAIAVVGLRWTLRLMRVLQLDPDTPIERLYFEFQQVLKDDSGIGTSFMNGTASKTLLTQEDLLAMEAFCAEWTLYQELVREANFSVLARQTSFNPDLAPLIFANVCLANICDGNWRNVDTLPILTRKCCFPFLGITSRSCSSCETHKAVINRWKREEAGQADRDSPILDQVYRHLQDIAHDTRIATRTFVLHTLWKRAQELVEWIQYAADSAPRVETIAPKFAWLTDTPDSGIWSSIKQACIQQLQTFLPTETKLVYDKWCKEHATELDQLEAQLERTVSTSSPLPTSVSSVFSLSASAATTSTASAASSSSRKIHVSSPFATRSIMDLDEPGSDQENKDDRYDDADDDHYMKPARETLTPDIPGVPNLPLQVTTPQGHATAAHERLVDKLCMVNKEVYLSTFIPEWTRLQTQVLDVTRRYIDSAMLCDGRGQSGASVIDADGTGTGTKTTNTRALLQQWCGFLTDTLALVSPSLSASCSDSKRRQELTDQLRQLQHSRQDWWVDRLAYRQFRIIMYLYRWMGGVPFGIPDRINSMNRADFEARVTACLDLEIHETEQVLEGERVFARQRSSNPTFAQEAEFFVRGIKTYQTAVGVFNKACHSGVCCSHLERVDDGGSGSDSSSSGKHRSGGASDSARHSTSLAHREQKVDSRTARKRVRTDSVNTGHVDDQVKLETATRPNKIVCITVGESMHHMTTIWDTKAKLLVTHHESLAHLCESIRKSHVAGGALLTTLADVSTNKAMKEVLAWLEKFTSYLEARNTQWLQDDVIVPSFVSVAIQGALIPRQSIITLEECLTWFVQCAIMTAFTSVM